MLLLRSPVLVIAVTALAVCCADRGAAAPDPGAHVVAVSTVRAPDLAQFEPGIVKNSRGVRLGGIGSGLYPARSKPGFWMVTDRGPNGEPKVNGTRRRTFPVPEFAPAIVRVVEQHGEASIVETVTLKNSNGTPISGRPDQASRDEKPHGWNGRTPLPYDPAGLDTEDIVVDYRGDFWLVDEYSPSLVRVAPDGRILARYVPKGLGLSATGYPVYETLPAIFASRVQNRGFEALGIGWFERALYLSMQSPLANPDKKSAAVSNVVRILKVDLDTGAPTAEWAYRMSDAKTFDPAADQSDMKISALNSLPSGRLLLEERTDAVARLYLVDPSRATNILDGPADSPATRPALESGVDAGVVAPSKSQAVDLAAVAGVPRKIEGVAIVDPFTVVVANDNDFGMGKVGPDGRLIDSGVPSRLLTLRLTNPMF